MDETPQDTAPASTSSVRHTIERKPGSVAVLSVEVDASRLTRQTDRVFARHVRQARIPGFRPGKAPRAIYERTYGTEHLWAEAAEDIIDETYREILQKEGLDPLDNPAVEIAKLEPGENLTYTATMPVRPEVTLEKEATEHGKAIDLKPVPDEDVRSTIDRMREQHAVLRPAEREAAMGDILIVDVDMAVDGKPPEPFGRQAHLEVGKSYALPGLTEGLVGAKSGEERALDLTFPEDYPDELLRAKTGTFTVKVGGIAEKVLPELNDDFAKTAGVADTAALERAVRNELVHGAFHEARDAAGDQVIDYLLENATVEVPEILVQDELDRLLAELKSRTQEQGLAYEQFLLQARKTEAELRAEWRTAAERRAKTLLVLDVVADKLGVSVTNQELAVEIANTPVADQDARALRDPRVLASIARSMRNRKVVDHLLGLDGPEGTREREYLKAAGAEVDALPEAKANELIVPEAKPQASSEGREALRKMGESAP